LKLQFVLEEFKSLFERILADRVVLIISKACALPTSAGK
jgi:hypothetical protein